MLFGAVKKVRGCFFTYTFGRKTGYAFPTESEAVTHLGDSFKRHYDRFKEEGQITIHRQGTQIQVTVSAGWEVRSR